VIRIVSEGTAIEVDPNRHRIVYKLQINGKFEYLVIGLDDDKSIHTLFPADPDRKLDYNSMGLFDQYILNIRVS